MVATWSAVASVTGAALRTADCAWDALRCGEIPSFGHGDLKPETVLVGGGRLSQASVNRLRVTDFGLAVVLKAEMLTCPNFSRQGKPLPSERN